MPGEEYGQRGRLRRLHMLWRVDFHFDLIDEVAAHQLCDGGEHGNYDLVILILITDRQTLFWQDADGILMESC